MTLKIYKKMARQLMKLNCRATVALLAVTAGVSAPKCRQPPASAN